MPGTQLPGSGREEINSHHAAPATRRPLPHHPRTSPARPAASSQARAHRELGGGRGGVDLRG